MFINSDTNVIPPKKKRRMYINIFFSIPLIYTSYVVGYFGNFTDPFLSILSNSPLRNTAKHPLLPTLSQPSLHLSHQLCRTNLNGGGEFDRDEDRGSNCIRRFKDPFNTTLHYLDIVYLKLAFLNTYCWCCCWYS